MANLSGNRSRRLFRGVVGGLAVALFALNLAALVGHVVRDRSAWLAPLIYLPLLPLGLGAVLVALGRRGRSLGRPRFALGIVGLAAIASGGFTMVGHGPGTPSAARGEVRLLHWNVLWGGRPNSEGRWDSIVEDIRRRRPDIVVLSEAPTAARVDSLTRRMGEGWSVASVGHEPGSPYWFGLGVLSRWPTRLERRYPVRNGVALAFVVERPGRPIRLLVVDGESKVTRPRTPMLHDVAAVCRKAAGEGRPFEAVLGDFNAVGRSVGFDALAEAGGGYSLASRSSRGWRGSWPSPLPLYDIDHVWVHHGVSILSCAFFANPASDHRGQLVRLAIPDRVVSYADGTAGRRHHSRPGQTWSAPVRPPVRASAPAIRPRSGALDHRWPIRDFEP